MSAGTAFQAGTRSMSKESLEAADGSSEMEKETHDGWNRFEPYEVKKGAGQAPTILR